ncbi:hypothetical protein DMUE_5323 [Dictyocoela muelleri]|nr:hypothetical protein DMUE_5323 [Dictyocoela muelleri]
MKEKERSLFAWSRLERHNNYFLSIYEILCRDYEKRILNDCHISKMSSQKIKENINKFYGEKNEIYKNIMLGGEYAVQIDETIIYKGKLILSPSNMYDELLDVHGW